jgi:hypothetical protein
MDTACLQHCLTDSERQAFEENGYLVVENALPPRLVEDLTAAYDRVHAKHCAESGTSPNEPLLLLDVVGRDELFLELLDWPKTFPKVWGILGWHIQLYHSHLNATPPEPGAGKRRLGWHQDSARLNADLETNPRPRISVKVGFFLTDTTDPNRGNFHVVPGSHLQNELDLPADGVSDPPGATPICVPAGAAVVFDRRIWHSGGINRSDSPRKVLFFGYSYRWLRPRDDMTVSHFMDRCDPIRRQLLGASGDGGFGRGHGYTTPKDEDVPLRAWIEEHLGAEAVVP